MPSVIGILCNVKNSGRCRMLKMYCTCYFFDIIEWTCLKSSSVVYQYLPYTYSFLSMSKDNAVNDVHHLGRNIAFNLTFKAMVKTQSIIVHSCIFHVTSLQYTLIYSLILESFRYVPLSIEYVTMLITSILNCYL